MLSDLLRQQKLFQMPFSKFKDLRTGVAAFPMKIWEYQIDYFKETLRTSRKIDLIKNTDIQQLNKDLETRLNTIAQIKTEHEDLRSIYASTFGGEQYIKLSLYKYNFPTEKDLEREFEVFLKLDPLNLDPEGQDQLKQAQGIYLKRTNELDKRIVEKIHQIFGQSLSNNEKF